MSSHDRYPTPSPAFPHLTPDNHQVIGPATDEFNCIGWACGDARNWWQPGPFFYWPVECDPDDITVGNLLAALAAIGYAACPDATPEPGFEKVAVYADGANNYTHAARLLPSGKWSSKLGVGVLIEHDTPEAVAGGAYGAVVQYMKRPLPTSP